MDSNVTQELKQFIDFAYHYMKLLEERDTAIIENDTQALDNCAEKFRILRESMGLPTINKSIN